jgi:WD40 repeat protein
LSETLKRAGKVNTVAISLDGQTLVSGSDDNSIKLWNLHNRELSTTLAGPGYVSCVAISSDGHMIVSGGDDKTIKVWNLHSGKLKLIRTLKGHSYSVKTVAISSNGKTLVSCDVRNIIKVWNLHTGKLCRRVPVFQSVTDINPDRLTAESVEYGSFMGNDIKVTKHWNLHTGELSETSMVSTEFDT